MTATDREILLLVLCGLPASGKTYLSRLIRDKYGSGSSVVRDQNTCTTSAIDVCYDRLLPAPDFLIAKCRGYTTASRWKQYRDSILGAVEALIVEIVLRGGDVAASISNSDETASIQRLVEDTLRNENSQTLDALQNEVERRVLFVIDDNMYYKSMRYDYYHLARKYNIGFCQIHVRCDIDTALRRNRSRRSADEQKSSSSEVQVDDNIIRAMNDKFESPDGSIRIWETMSLTLDNDDEHLESRLPSLDEFLNVAFAHRVQHLVDEDDDNQEEQKAASRLACRRNVLHRVDGLLRKLVSKAAKTDSTRPNVDRLNAARRELMTDIKNGGILLEKDLLRCLDSGEVADDVSEDLNRFLEDKLNAVTSKKT